MNKVILIGRLVKDPVVFGGGAVVKIKLSTRVGYDVKKQEELIAFVPVTLFSLSKIQVGNLKKGVAVGVEGLVTEVSFDRGKEVVYQTDVQVKRHGLRFM